MGERLGRYSVLKHLASGGMADVLLARTDGIEGFARHVVLKRIRAEHAKDRRFIEMFLDEARLAAGLHHQNIVQVHDIGEADGEYFFAMEYLHGEDVRTLLAAVGKTRSHVPLEHVVGIVSSAAAGLHYAHERKGADKQPLGIVHRDVSPSNILVGYDGSVKVVDFGIAKAAMKQGDTRTGHLKGKVSYMSPEQCKLGEIDRRSDVYSLGVVLYELATSSRLFKSDSDYLVMDAICTGKIPAPRMRRPDLPPALTAIIMKALATDADKRYQTADELRTALDEFAVEHKLAISAPVIATYLKKVFNGEKPEPWLEGAAAAPRTDDEARTTTDGKATVTSPVHTAVDASADTIAADRAPPPARGMPPAKIAMIAVPAVAVIGLLVWKLTAGSSPENAPVATAPAPAPATAVSPPSAPSAAPRDATVARPVEGSAATAPPPVETKPAVTETPKPGTGSAAAARPTEPPKPGAGSAAMTKPIETAKPVETAKPGAGSAATTKPSEAAKPGEVARPGAGSAATTKPVGAGSGSATTVAKVPDPKPPENGAGSGSAATTKPVTPPPPAALPTISATTVNNVATVNRKQIASCEGGAELHGDITVRFEVDANGKVVKSSVSSTVNNPKVSSCMQRAVQTWQFPKTASTGVYAITYY